MLFNADQTNNAVPLNQSLRLDGRDQLEIRTPTITFGPDPGWLRRVTDRTTLASVTSHPVSLHMSTVKPPPERPFEGIRITIHSEMSPMASVDYELVHCLADAGNMLDSACLADITLEVIGDDVVVACTSPGMWFSFLHVAHMHAPEERAPVPLAIPFCVTFAFFPDPTTRSWLSAGAMSIQREICVLHKAGGMLTAPDEILNVAVGIAKELDQLVEARLRKDWAERKVEVR
ncbi:hypothetical protein EV363DRAFT_1436479 [Boletus edulis]|nr:hypothetical protein EV363DRAFT_1436479 [Boletus edulis]